MTDANFLSSVAHELRNPIAVIRALAQTLSRSRERLSEDEVNECLSRLLRQADRLGYLVEDLVSSSQSSGERLRVILESVELRGIVDRAVESVPQPSGKTLDVDVPSGMWVGADGFRLEQVFTNLLDNAYRYGGSRVQLQARRDEGDRVLVTLSDDGDGVPEELVPALFDQLSRGANETDGRAWGWGSPLPERWWLPVGATFGTSLLFREVPDSMPS